MTADESLGRLDDEDYPAYTMGRAAELLGTTPGFLRAIGEARLITPLRSEGGHRRYSADDVRWIELLKRLHASDMSIRRMLELARLHRRGASTIAARRELLASHRRDIEARIARLRAALGTVRAKLARYDRALAKRRA